MKMDDATPGMLVQARKELKPGYWATGLLLGEVVSKDSLHVYVKFIRHSIHKDYEGHKYYCNPYHLIPVSKSKSTNVNDELCSMFGGG